MRLALGTVQFGMNYGIANQLGQVPGDEIKAMLRRAAATGVDTLDTAINYGESELRLGEAGVEDFRIVTKLPAIPDGCGDVTSWVRGQVSASYSRLGVSRVYGLLLHRPDQLLGSNGATLLQSLKDLKSSGNVLKIGVSIYDPGELEAITKLFVPDLVQAPFNLVDRRLQTTGWLRRLKDSGVEVHTRSAFLQGLLVMQNTTRPIKFAPWNSLWDRWCAWLAHLNVSALQAALAFPLGFSEIDRVVVGADSLEQLAQIIDAASSITPADWPDLQCDDENLINPSRWTNL